MKKERFMKVEDSKAIDMGGGDNSLKVGFLGRFLSDHCIKVFKRC